jgi:hypothetical protein
MSQQLIPVNGGVVPEIQTTTVTSRLNVLSRPYIEVKNLHSRPTEWAPGGRPIYRRLPAISETYQIDFSSVVKESSALGNTFVAEEIEEIGYVFIPYSESIDGALSMGIVSSDNRKTLLIKAGAIVWKYGKTEVLPTIVDLGVLDVEAGLYDVGYQLIYDDAPLPLRYEVSDYALTGTDLNISSSTDEITGWRYPAVNAFLNSSNQFWANKDTLFPTYSQPTTGSIRWQSTLPQQYTSIVLRCPPSTAYTGTATLSYVTDAATIFVATVDISADSTGQFFELLVNQPSDQTGWEVTFSSLDISIQSIAVSGVVTILKPLAEPSPRATLVMYPAGTSPLSVENTEGEQIPATYCSLAQVEVGAVYDVVSIQDTRNIINRDYVPVADWLTVPFDRDLINLYEQVSSFSETWMAPPSCMKQEYADLLTNGIVVEA